MTTGIVKWFNSTKGFGFIQSDNDDPDAFEYCFSASLALSAGLFAAW